MLTCNGRGVGFHEEANVEAQVLQREVPGATFIGMFAGGEYGPTDTWVGIPSPLESLKSEPGLLPQMGDHAFSCAVAMLSSS